MREARISDQFYKYGLYMVLAVLIVVFTSINSKFLSLTNGLHLLQQTATTGIAACGLVFVIIAGGIDLSMGSVMFFTATILSILSTMNLGLVPSLAISIALGAAIGAINGLFIAKLKVAPLITTLAMLYIIRGLGIVIGGTGLRYFSNAASEAIVFTRLFGAIPVLVLILLVTMTIGQVLLNRTVFGRQLYAIGNNRQAAMIMGIKSSRNIFISYVACGACAGLAGLVSGAQVGGIGSTFATGQEFIIISATILGGVSLFGGKGRVFPGAFLGVLIIMVIENGLIMAKTDLYFYAIIRGLIIFIAVMLDCIRNRGEHR